MTSGEPIPFRLGEVAPEDGLAERLGADRLRLRRAWPREPGRLLLEYATPAGVIVGAQWMRDREQLRLVGEEASRAGGVVGYGRGGGLDVLIQACGADRHLRALSLFLREQDAWLVSHRVERRAVARLRSGAFAKFSRKHAAMRESLERGTAVFASPGRRFAVPYPVEVNDADCWVVWSPLPGVSWQEAIAGGAAPRVSRTVGRALRSLHGLTPPEGIVSHDPLAEARALERWVHSAHDYQLVDNECLDAARRLASLLSAPSSELCLIHRDFHDRQVLIGPDRVVGIIDFDTLAVGDPGIDLGNAVAHLEHALPRLGISRGVIEAHIDALLSGYQADGAKLARLELFREATALRLRCLHAFRRPLQAS